MNDKTELLPCPLCGSEQVGGIGGRCTGDETSTADCNCGLSLKRRGVLSEAIAHWNTRQSQQAQGDEKPVLTVRVNGDNIETDTHTDVLADLPGGTHHAYFATFSAPSSASERITLNAKQLREAAYWANPDNEPDQEETEVDITWMPERTSSDGTKMSAGYYLYFSEYPEEGVLGPLGETPSSPAPATSPDHTGDTCDRCERVYTCVYNVPDDVWPKIAPRPETLGEHNYGGGLLCPDCAATEAKRLGVRLIFEGKEWEEFPNPAPAAVPDKMTPDRAEQFVLEPDDRESLRFSQGWNLCRTAMLAAAPTPAEPATVPEGYTLVPDSKDADEIVSRLYRRFKEWSQRGFTAEDVTWCEVRADILAMMAPPQQSQTAKRPKNDRPLTFTRPPDLLGRQTVSVLRHQQPHGRNAQRAAMQVLRTDCHARRSRRLSRRITGRDERMLRTRKGSKSLHSVPGWVDDTRRASAF